MLGSYKDKINPETIDRNGITAFTILQKAPPEDMLPLIDRLDR